MDWFSSFQTKSTLSGNTIQQQRINAKNDMFLTRFKDSLMYNAVGLGDTNTLYDTWISSEQAYTQLINIKKLELAPNQDLSKFYTGQYVYWTVDDVNEVWLITSSDKRPPNNPFGLIEKCDSLLKWIDGNGVIQSYNVVISDKVERDYLKPNINGTSQEGYITVKLEKDNNTNLLRMNDRFLFGTEGNYNAFKVDFVKNFFNFPYLELIMYIDPISPYDDLASGIANSLNIIPPSPTPINGNVITPNVTDILQGNTEIYMVQHLVNGIANSDTFTITASGVNSSSNYILNIIDGNSFSVTNLLFTNVPLVVDCVNDLDGSDCSISINLKGTF